MEEQGTRQRTGFLYSHPESRFPNGRNSRDNGLNKYLVISATFSSSTITDAASDFVAAGFLANDQIVLTGSASNNGVRTIISVATTALTVDFPVVTEGPTAGVIVRTP